MFVLSFVKVDIFHGVSLHGNYCDELEAGTGRAPSTCPQIPLPFSSKQAPLYDYSQRPASVSLPQVRPQAAGPYFAIAQ